MTTGSEEEKAVEAEIRARRALFTLNISKYVTGASVLVMVSTVILWLFFRRYIQLLANAAVILLPTAGGGLYPVLHHRGQVRIGIYLLPRR